MSFKMSAQSDRFDGARCPFTSPYVSRFTCQDQNYISRNAVKALDTIPEPRSMESQRNVDLWGTYLSQKIF